MRVRLNHFKILGNICNSVILDGEWDEPWTLSSEISVEIPTQTLTTFLNYGFFIHMKRLIILI